MIETTVRVLCTSTLYVILTTQTYRPLRPDVLTERCQMEWPTETTYLIGFHLSIITNPMRSTRLTLALCMLPSAVLGTRFSAFPPPPSPLPAPRSAFSLQNPRTCLADHVRQPFAHCMIDLLQDPNNGFQLDQPELSGYSPIHLGRRRQRTGSDQRKSTGTKWWCGESAAEGTRLGDPKCLYQLQKGQSKGNRCHGRSRRRISRGEMKELNDVW